jgi:photosystem II stability/assembly factor-like uncharacterized protein
MRVCRSSPLQSVITGIFLSLLLTLPPVAEGGVNAWTSGGPAPGGKYVRALAADPSTSDTLYAGTQFDGVFRSTDAGASWTAVNSGLTDLNVFALAIDPAAPSTLYAGTTGTGVFKSTDGGASWIPASTGLSTLTVLALAVDPTTPTTVYAGTDGGGVFKSVDAGASWTAMNVGLTVATVNTISVDPVTPTTLYAGTTGGSGGVFKSTDAAASWSLTSPVWTVPCIAIDPQTPSTIYAGRYSLGVSKSLDGGQTWTDMNAGLTTTAVRSLAIDPTTPATLAVATLGGGVFLSQDGGGTWTSFNAGLANLNTLAVVVDPSMPRLLHAGALGSGVFDYEQDACDDGGAPVVCGGCEVCNPAFGCVGEVWSGCHDPILSHKAKLHIKDKSPNARDRIVWKWLRGEATTIDEYGNPLEATDYALCIFDLSGPQPTVVLHATAPAGGECGPKACWREVGGRRYKYRNGEATPDGLSKLLLNEGDDEKAKIILKGHGDLLNVPTLPLNLPFLLQLRASNGQCWEALYTDHGTIKNDGQIFVGASGL